jgi:hypothetical protein
MVGPRALNATTTVLDVGAGGFTEDFSDFQLLLPAKMEKCSPWQEGQVSNLNTTLSYSPTVCVTDVGGEAVAGATVHFATSDGSVSSPSVVTNAYGVAAVDWTIGTLGTNTLVASGNGIGGADVNGPRATVDPFQPLSHAFGDPTDGPAVAVLTGSQSFTAAGAAGYVSSGWSFQIDGSPPVDWFSATVSPLMSVGAAPFGSANAGCELNNAGFSTSWPPSGSTFLYARKTFTLATAASVRIGVAIDNDVQVFLDGVDISASNEQNAAPDGGLLLHEGCPTTDSFTFVTAALSAGPHIVAFRARDRGVSSYFDASVTISPP